MCAMAEIVSPKEGGSSRRAGGLDGGFHSVSAVQPPFQTLNLEVERRWDGVAVLERRMRRREIEMGIMEELAEQRIIKSDYEGFRRLGEKVWKMKMHNFRVMVAVLRVQMQESQEFLAKVRGGAA